MAESSEPSTPKVDAVPYPIGRRRSALRCFPPAEIPHFLDSCALCRKPLGQNRDIFMYRGDTPFCSEECRQEQIDADEVKGRKWSNLAARALKKEEKKRIPVQTTGTVVVG